MVGIINRNTADYVEQKQVQLGELDFFSPEAGFSKPILKLSWALCRDVACLAEAAKQNERHLPPLLVKDIEGVLIEAGSMLHASWDEEELGLFDKSSIINQLRSIAGAYESLKVKLEDDFHIKPTETPGRYENLLKEPTRSRVKQIFKLVAAVLAVLTPIIVLGALIGVGVVTGALPIAFGCLVSMIFMLYPGICLVHGIIAMRSKLRANPINQKIFQTE
ncbi:hypothetical protein [Chlamydiifrater phoenicopteri]|uniref:hypothetical protein n=1 Tax=Chlamydiifrater phoenicopteri TaxID=2681469 RepID=UPI001BCCBE92|nr:hypothetical protein [Chlamydiifrater phoenicopteri]